MAVDPYHQLLGSSLPIPSVLASVAGPVAPVLPSLPATPFLTAAQLAQMQLAAAAAEVQACAQVQAQAQVAHQFMQWMELNRQAALREQDADDGGPYLPPGMTLRLAARGLAPPTPTLQESPKVAAANPEAVAATPPPELPAPGAPHALGRSHTSRCPGGTPASTTPSVKAKALTPASGGNKKARETLRTYLQELRGEDPRCVFITRRINKLGFRSKSLLERHYTQFGDVVQVLVAHSKVKPFPNSGTLPRTRPGNFGLVVMKHPEAVLKILAQGSEQLVSGVEIHVHMFEQLRMEKDLEEEEMMSSGGGADVAQPRQSHSHPGAKADEGNDSMGSGSVGSSGDALQENLQDQEDDWNVFTSSSAGSEKDGSVENTGTTMSVMDWRRMRSTSQSYSQSGTGSGPSYCSGNTSVNGSDQGSQSSGGLASGHPRTQDLLPPPAIGGLPQLDRLDMQRLGQWARSYTTTPLLAPPVEKYAPDPPEGVSSTLAVVLSELSTIARDFDQMNNFTREQSMQAAALAQWAQQSLKRLEQECQQKIAELSHLPPAPGLGVQGAAPATLPPPAHVSYPWPPPAKAAGRALLHVSGPPHGEQPVPTSHYLTASQLGAMTQLQPPAAGAAGLHSVLGVAGAGAAQRTAAGALSADSSATAATTPASKSLAADSSETTTSSAVALKATARRNRQRSEENSGARDTLRSHLTELSNEDPSCIFITRRINKLGFRSREILQQHYSQYGEVSRVLVAHSKVKPFRDSSGQLRTRPGGLGLVVMRAAPAVKRIITLGEEQMVAGHPIRIQSFERPKVDEAGYNGSETSTTASKSQGTGSEGSGGRSAENPEGGSSNGKSEEGGSSNDPYEKSDADAGSSGGESPECSSSR